MAESYKPYKEPYKTRYVSEIKDLPKEAAFAIFENSNDYGDSKYVKIRWVESQADLREFLLKHMSEVGKFIVMNLRPVVVDFDVTVNVRFD